MPVLLKGSCRCGAVAFEVESHTPVPFMLCYCSICRKQQGGGGFAINLGAVVRATEPDFALVECFATGNQCIITKRCQLPGVLNEALNAFVQTLDRYTLADILLTRRDFLPPKGPTKETRGPRFTAAGTKR